MPTPKKAQAQPDMVPLEHRVSYFQPVTLQQAEAAARAEHAMLAKHACGNLVTLNDVPGPVVA